MFRRTAFLVTIGLSLAACSASTAPDPNAIGPSGMNRPSGGATASGSPRADGSPTGAPRPGPSGSVATATGRPTTFTPPSYADAGGVGAMARAYLRAQPARRLVVEVDWVRGRAPSAVALDHMMSVLRRELRKPDGIVLDRDDELPEARDGRYSNEDLVGVVERYRDHRSSGSTAAMYLLFLDGEYEEVDGAIGVAFLASAAAIFSDQVNDAATALVQPAAVERAVVMHEVGHLLALVNLGYESRHDHEDPDHPYHSKYRDSVMFWAVEDISVTSILTGGPPGDFDRYDRDDLAFLRGD